MKKAQYEIVDNRVVLTAKYHTQWGDIPRGTSFDGYTIPKCLYWFHRPLEGDLTPAIIHDWMLWNGHEYAHNAFKIALKECGFKQPRRQIMYLAARLYQSIFYPDIFK